MSSRIYVVTMRDPEEGKIQKESLIRAASSSQAIRCCAEPMFQAKVASQDDLIRLIKTQTVKEV